MAVRFRARIKSSSASLIWRIGIAAVATIALPQVVAAQLQLDVHWEGVPAAGMVQARLSSAPVEGLKECLAAGFEFRSMIEIELCKHRPFWMDSCAERRSFEHQLSKDPVTGTFVLITTKYLDGVVANEDRVRLSSLKAASKESALFSKIPVSELADGRQGLGNSRRAYLALRAATSCQINPKNNSIGGMLVSPQLANTTDLRTRWVDFWLNW